MPPFEATRRGRSRQRISIALYVAVALVWLVPDRRIESRLERRPGSRIGSLARMP